jgi:LacI family transcriptional regulator
VHLKAKRVTSQDVAQLAGVSRTTVSLVLNHVEGTQISPETARRVFEAAEQLGYVPDANAQALASRRSQLIGLVLARRLHTIASDTYLTQILEGVVDTLSATGYRLLVDVVEEVIDRQAYLRLVRANHVDGLLISGPRLDDAALEGLVADGFPAVLIGSLPGVDLCSVDVDNQAAARQAVEHLIRLGHRRIACIPHASPTFAASLDRLTGYREALATHRLPYDTALVQYADFSPQSGYTAMQALLQAAPGFTAAFVSSDTVAVGALSALRTANLSVPQEVAVVGFDDLPLAGFTTPALTTVALPVTGMAQAACQILLRQLAGQPPIACHVRLESRLVVRESCGGWLEE